MKIIQKKILMEENGMRLDRWVKFHYPEISFSSLQKLLRSGQIRIDKKRCRSNTRLELDQIIRFPYFEENIQTSSVLTQNSLKNCKDEEVLTRMLLYKDEKIFVLNKPSGISVQGGSGVTRHIDAMLECWRNKKGEKPRLVHRIDRDTSGVLIIARTRAVAQHLTEAFRKRAVKKTYWAVVRGVPKKREDRLSSWLCKKKNLGIDYMDVCNHGDEHSVHAISVYSLMDTAAQNLAWLKMEPLTGRMHQLRVQAAHMGHPILGDPKYFYHEPSWTFPRGIQNKLHLHARSIFLPDFYDQKLEISAPLPPHMVQTFNLLGFDKNLA